MKTSLKWLEWSGSITGMLAAAMLALNVSISPWAYVFYLASSVFLLAWAWQVNAHGVAMQNAFFVLINCIGIYRWLWVGQ